MADKDKPVCGIVMPISAIDGCSETHWSDVLSIFTEAIEEAGFQANIVSNADDVGIIQKRIIQNLYSNPIVVCDVSGKNPNVMFELGLRLAFDKPTIIVKDNATAYSFDTSPIEHLDYPRDLRFSKIVEFKEKLAEKIIATHTASQSDRNYTTFLKHFGQFTVAKLEEKEVGPQEFIMEELQSIRRILLSERPRLARETSGVVRKRDSIDLCLRNDTDAQISRARKILESHPACTGIDLRSVGNHEHMIAIFDTNIEVDIEKLSIEARSALGDGSKPRSARQKPS